MATTAAFTTTYSRDELLAMYLNKYPRKNMFAGPVPARSSVFFFWDPTAKLLINPYNLTADASTKPGNYSIATEVYNFHPSSVDDNAVWSQLGTNLQITFTAQAADDNNDIFQWIILAGLQFASNFLGGADGKLLSAGDQAQLTSKVPASQQIEVTNGAVSLSVGLAGQKKKGFWDEFIQVFTGVASAAAPVLGVLPIPKLAESAVDAVSSLLTQVEQQEKLIQVLAGKLLPFRLYDGTSSNPFLLKAGTWIVMDATEAGPHIDAADNNIHDIVLDVPGQLWELKDKNGAAVDMTYSVLNILLPPVKPVED